MAWITVTPFVVWLLVSTLIRWNRESDQRSAANIYTAPRNLPFQAPASGTSVEDRPVDLPSLSSLSQLQVNAEQGDKEAQYQLGKAYINGDGVAKDPKEAVKWLQHAADQGHAEAQFNLGVSYANGEGVNEDAEEAVKWFRKAAEQGESKAQCALGASYQTGTGILKNPEQAASWYRKAADQGHPNAQFELALFYALGEGVPENAAEAMKWFHTAAVQGHARAQYILGDSYANGDGLPKDEAAAVSWYRKAAEQGEADGQQKLGACYEKGIGVAKDAVEAAKWYHMAASQGHARAQFDFGFCCKLGEGVIKNSVLGHMWLNLASAQGEKAAKNALSMLEAEMTPAQIAEAKNLAANFRPTKDESQNDTPQSVNSASKIVSPSAGPSVQEEMSDDEKDRQFQIMVEAWEAEAGRAFPDANIAGSALSLAIEQQLNVIKRTDPEYLLRSPDAGYKLVAAEAAKLGIAPLSHPSKSFLSALPTAKDMAGTLELRHLPSDERLTSGSILTDRLTPLGGKGKLSLDNGLTEDAFVKMISNDRLVASFYVRGGEKFTYTHVPDGVYRLIYCTGFGWEAARRDFERGRHAMRYDEALDFTTTRRTEGNSIITSTGVMTLTLHKVANGNARTSGIPLEEFDRY
jgi:hypothetical protein